MNASDTLKESIEFLRHDRRFQEVLGEIVAMRETAIIEFGEYTTITGLRKAAAEVTVFTDILNLFGVPTGTPVPKPE